MHSRITLLALIVSFFAVTSLGLQEAHATDWGPRVGLRSDPDQLFGGVHFDAGEIWENVRFQPSIDIGSGQDILLIAGNAALHYRFTDVNGDWTPYAGGELALQYLDFDIDLPAGSSGNVDDTDIEIGLSGTVGIEKTLSSGRRLSVELRLGLADTPDFQAHVGWTFGGTRTRQSTAGQ
jgi:hypothetical protein